MEFSGWLASLSHESLHKLHLLTWCHYIANLVGHKNPPICAQWLFSWSEMTALSKNYFSVISLPYVLLQYIPHAILTSWNSISIHHSKHNANFALNYIPPVSLISGLYWPQCNTLLFGGHDHILSILCACHDLNCSEKRYNCMYERKKWSETNCKSR